MATASINTLSTSQQQQDEVMSQLQPFQRVQLNDDEIICEYVHESLLKKNGIIIQFINTNAAGATTLIGGIRLALADIRKAPAYLSKHKGIVKSHGIRMLNKHFLETQCSAGAGESLTHDDYGISFSLASISSVGLNLNPVRRNEGPLFYCLFTGLHEPTCVQEVAWDEGKSAEVTYVINAYIHLLPTTLRRHRVLSKPKPDPDQPKDDDDSAKAAKKPRTFFQGEASNYPHPYPYPPRGGYQERKLREEFDNLRQELASVKSKAANDIAALQAQAANNPGLPKSKVTWPPKDPNQGPDLPDE
jgi:hypothetical protein